MPHELLFVLPRVEQQEQREGGEGGEIDES
jgi:hypothetical protein